MKEDKTDQAKKTEEPKQDTETKITEEISEEKKKIAELTDLVKRVQADFENYKKRADKEKAEFTKYASKKLILKLLHVTDNFDLAIKHKESKEEFIKAMEMIHAQLHSLLESEGVKPMKTEGEKFSPYKHEALMHENNKEKEDNTILEEFQKGYTMHDEVIRPSKVKINKKTEEKK